MNRRLAPIVLPRDWCRRLPGKVGSAVLAWLLCCSPIVHALDEDQNQPVRIQADRVTLDERKSVSLYEGNVVVTQGGMRLTADIVRVFADRKRLDRIVAEGDLVEFRQQSDKSEEIRAEARQIEYRASDQMVILVGQAKLWQGPNTFASERIEYDTVREVVNAGDNSGKGRVEVIIMPRDAKELLKQ